jgi:hypothetical protein
MTPAAAADVDGWFLWTMAFFFGASLGSFLNVCIYRIPAEESVVRPSSRCPSCRNPIAWYDNVPILSWMLLGGRCRRCRTGIAGRYPFVEAATGARRSPRCGASARRRPRSSRSRSPRRCADHVHRFRPPVHP